MIGPIVLFLGGICAFGETLDVGRPTTDNNGVLYYPVTSSYQGEQPNILRVLLPTNPPPDTMVRFLYALPVESGLQTTYGDGLETLRLLNVHNQYNFIIVAPSFAQTPWFADHPKDLDTRQEGYLINHIVPTVDSLFPQKTPLRALLGFSKSGWGAMSLLIRHDDLFATAGVFDAPLAMTQINPIYPGMAELFATETHFDTYEIPTFLPQEAKALNQSTRAWLAYSDSLEFFNDMEAIHNQMNALEIPHEYVATPFAGHVWADDWVIQAANFLHRATRLAADVTGDGAVDIEDLLAVINAWGACPSPCPPACGADIAPNGGNCAVDIDDLLKVIVNWD